MFPGLFQNFLNFIPRGLEARDNAETPVRFLFEHSLIMGEIFDLELIHIKLSVHELAHGNTCTRFWFGLSWETFLYMNQIFEQQPSTGKRCVIAQASIWLITNMNAIHRISLRLLLSIYGSR